MARATLRRCRPQGKAAIVPHTNANVAHVDLEVLEHDADQPLLLARGEAVQHPSQDLALVGVVVQVVQDLGRGSQSGRKSSQGRAATHRVDVPDGGAGLGQWGTVLQHKLQNGGEIAHSVAGRDAAGADLVRILRTSAVTASAHGAQAAAMTRTLYLMSSSASATRASRPRFAT